MSQKQLHYKSSILTGQPLNTRCYSIHLESLFGLREAIFINQVDYWLQRSKRTFAGRKWFYKTYEDWKIEFPNWSVTSIRNIVRKLKQAGILLTDCRKNKIKSDWTNWYSLNYSHSAFQVSEIDTTGVKNEHHRCQKVTPQVSESDGSYQRERREHQESTQAGRQPEKINEIHSKENEIKADFVGNGNEKIVGEITEKIRAGLKYELTVPHLVGAIEAGFGSGIAKDAKDHAKRVADLKSTKRDSRPLQKKILADIFLDLKDGTNDREVAFKPESKEAKQDRIDDWKAEQEASKRKMEEWRNNSDYKEAVELLPRLSKAERNEIEKQKESLPEGFYIQYLIRLLPEIRQMVEENENLLSEAA